MRMYKLLENSTVIFQRSNKQILYETIDFVFKPNHIFKKIIIKPSFYKIPNVPYKKQYEQRDTN